MPPVPECCAPSVANHGGVRYLGWCSQFRDFRLETRRIEPVRQFQAPGDSALGTCSDGASTRDWRQEGKAVSMFVFSLGVF